MSSPASTARKAVKSASWMSLLALSLGVASSRTTSTEIRGEAPSGRGPMRLVVQEYEADAAGNLSRRARPRTFAQRSVTPAELRKGVQVELVDLSDKRTPGDRVVVAWVERGEVSGSFDGRTAKPAPGSVVAKSKAGAGRVQLTLALPALRIRRRSPAALDLPDEVRAETTRSLASRADVVLAATRAGRSFARTKNALTYAARLPLPARRDAGGGRGPTP